MKSLRYLIVLVVAVALGLLGSLVKPANEGALAQGQAGCTVTLEPGRSIQKAINKAPAGAVICLTEGTWEENIVIEKSVTLRGEGQEKTVIAGVKEGYPVIWVRTPAEQEVLVQFEGLLITGAEGGCAETDPFHGTWGRSICANGMLLQGSARATISNSNISGNGVDGIELWDSVQATISSSTISGNGWDGIRLFDSARATISNSTISGNGYRGIYLKDSVQATISDSAISGNGEEGIELYDSARATISNSTISENKRNGILLFGSAQATISNSTVSGNATDGIEFGGLNSARVTVSNSTISGNGYRGIYLGDSAQATISNSTISGNGGTTFYGYKCGIYLKDSAQATISNSTIFENNYDGIKLEGSAKATISGNLIKGNIGCGIYSSSSMEVRGEANEMADNGNDLCGNLPGSLRLPLRDPTEGEITWPDERYKSLQEAVDALLPGGKLRLKAGEHQAGVTITKELRVEAEEGEKVALIAKSPYAPVLSLVGMAKKVELVGLKLSKGREGLLLGADTQVTISDSIIEIEAYGGYANYLEVGGIWLWGSAQATISSSTISGNGWDGIRLFDSAKATISNSNISGSDLGIYLEGSAKATISNSNISGNHFGIYLKGSAQATISGSTISRNIEAIPYFSSDAITLYGSAQVTISGSTISRNSDAITLFDSSQATISNCTISGNSYSIQLFDSSQATISNSTISGSVWDGIYLGDSAQATISNSTISRNGENGIALHGAATVTLKGSTVEENGTCPDCAKADRICNGITVLGKSQATIIDSKIINNTDWGVAAKLKKCGYDEDYFTGKVEFQGTNVIKGNGAGQVCLP